MSNAQYDADENMTTPEVSDYLRVSKSKVRAMRAAALKGDPDASPPWHKVGNLCVYRRVDVENWFDAQLTDIPA